jgi:PAS domain S-box-containing protein
MTTILIVEDDRDLAWHWQEALEKENFRVVHETSLQHAIDALDEIAFDLVITDIAIEGGFSGLSVAGGLAVISYISLNLDPQPKVIATSGLEDNAVLVEQGFTNVDSLRALRKPFAVEALISVVKEILQEDESTADRLPSEFVPTKTTQAPIEEQMVSRTVLVRELRNMLQSNSAMMELLGATDGVWDWQIGTDVVTFTAAWRTMLGFDGDDTSGLPDTLDAFSSRIHPDDRQAYWDKVEESLAAKGPFTHEFRIKKKNGEFIWVRSRAATSFADDGEAVRMVGSTFDITEQVDATNRLKKTQETIDTAADAILWVNADGEITYANRTACDRLQYSAAELTRLKITAINPDIKSQNEYRTRFWPMIQREKSVTFELRHKRRDGTTFPVEIATHLIEFDDDVFACSVVRDLTDEHAAKEKSRTLAFSNQAMIELLSYSDGVWDWTVGTDEVTYAPGWRKMLGFDGDDQFGFPDSLEAFTQRIHDDDRAGVWSAIQECLETSHPDKPNAFVREFRLQKRSGEYIWTRSRAAPAFDSDGKPVRLVGSTYDITDQMEARNALIEKSKELEHLIDWMPQALIYADSTRRITRVNREFHERFGYQDDEVIGQTTQMLYADTDSFSRTGGERFNVDAGERKDSYEVLYRCKDGTEFPGETLGSVLQDADGKTLAFVGLVQDITRRKQSEQKLKTAFADLATAEKRFREVADINTPCWILAADSTCSWLNRQWLEYAGASLETQLGFGWTESVHPDDMQKTKVAYQNAVRDQDDFQLEHRLRRHDGQYRQHLTIGRARRDGDGEFEGFVGYSIDIHDERESQRELTRLNAELTQSNADMEQFTYVASHDLKQPLRGINLLAGWIYEDSYEQLSETSRTHLKQMQERVGRLDRLLSDLLEYSRAGQNSDDEKSVNIAETVSGMVELLAPPKDLTVKYVGPNITIQTNRTELELVLRNLIGNAIKHGSSHNGTIEIDTNVNADVVEFSVRDDGPGIAPEHHERIFQMFQTLVAKDGVQGTGVGLAIVKKTVESKGGSVTLESLETRGTTFKFTWPFTAVPSGETVK